MSVQECKEKIEAQVKIIEKEDCLPEGLEEDEGFEGIPETSSSSIEGTNFLKKVRVKI